MVYGVLSKKRWFPLIPVIFLTAWLGIEMEHLRAQDPQLNQTKAKPAEAEKVNEKDAQKMIDESLRLVLTQRRAMLQEIVRKHPQTQAAAQASAMLAQNSARNEHTANRKLREALHSPVCFDQRWRRLKEIEQHYPNTSAAREARQLFEQHLAQIPPMVITNHSDQKAELTVDAPYSRLTQVKLLPGQTQSVYSPFGMMVRLNVGDNEWKVYRTLPGLRYLLETTDGSPVLYYLP